jgi:hypothetical protein
VVKILPAHWLLAMELDDAWGRRVYSENPREGRVSARSGYRMRAGFAPEQIQKKIITVGVDACPQAVEEAKKADVHDHYIVANVLNEDVENILSAVNQEKFDIVTLYGVIEHFQKRKGLEMLEKCEQLSSKYIVLETPNGFVEQGPEFGNEFQRHLSGWYQSDLEGLGYKVYGATGSKYFRGYMARAKFRILGSDLPCLVCDVIATLLLRIRRHPRHAFNLIAIKDVRGVPARCL